MHFVTVLSFSLTVLGLSQAQTLSIAAQPSQAANVVTHFCGKWAGSPNPADVPVQQQLPISDFVKRFFIEPQLTNPPYKPFMATEEKVQIPKIWGNNNFRLALLSYYEETPARRLYSSSKSRWAEFHEALTGLMNDCVSKGSGGAYLVPPSPGLTQATLVLYAYEIGSKFDFTMNYYMTAPYGINPATLGTADNMTVFDPSVVVSASPDERMAIASAPPSGYEYVGCYAEPTNGTRALAAGNGFNKRMTVKQCAQTSKSSRYFGVEFGTRCFFGLEIQNDATNVTDGCNMPCSGDNTVMCGGAGYLNIYEKLVQTS